MYHFHFILFCVIILNFCISSYEIKDNYVLNNNEGILAINLGYTQGIDFADEVIFSIENINDKIYFNININSNSFIKKIFKLKSGYYYFSYVKVKSSSKGNSKPSSYSYEGKIYENIFQIEANKINFLDTIITQISKQRIGKKSILYSKDNKNKKILYFFQIFKANSLKKFSNKYPNIFSNYLLVKKRIILGNNSFELKEKINKK